MKFTYFLKISIRLLLLFSTGCKKGCGNNNNSDDDELNELLKDEEGATSFRVYFNYMDGSEYQMVNVNLDKMVTRPNAPTREGYKFIGWYEDKNGTIPYVFSTPITKSIMLYAIWEEVPFVDYSGLLNEIVPDKVEDDIDLIRRHPDNNFSNRYCYSWL